MAVPVQVCHDALKTVHAYMSCTCESRRESYGTIARRDLAELARVTHVAGAAAAGGGYAQVFIEKYADKLAAKKRVADEAASESSADRGAAQGPERCHAPTV